MAPMYCEARAKKNNAVIMTAEAFIVTGAFLINGIPSVLLLIKATLASNRSKYYAKDKPREGYLLKVYLIYI